MEGRRGLKIKRRNLLWVTGKACRRK